MPRIPEKASADRNLLFGILAIQMDFVPRDALIAAMHAWILEKSKCLGQILLEQNALTDETHSLLEALIQKHVEMHGGSTEQSLASVAAAESIREELEQISDPDLQQSLARVTVAPYRVEDPFATQSCQVGTATSPGLRYRILRPHAQGGLGKVSIAHDEELHREVAFKELLERHADNPPSRARFLLEAEVTGALEHPGVVPVYGLGHYEDGRPFYAMRFIKGYTLKEAIDRFHQAATANTAEKDLEFRQLLSRFIAVCNAAAYAQSRGILHRDLKPANIMLGKFGETLVVDWGLAKPVTQTDSPFECLSERPFRPLYGDNNPAQTVEGQAVGTPAYMSPEQAAGRLDLLTIATDIYSLGATLYTLLTGRPPFQTKDLEKVLREVQRGEYPKPRVIRPTIPTALEAICLKAMAFKPEDRYPSTSALSDDLEKWLADDPVSAYPEPWTGRARRWVSRHRTLVVSGAAVLAVAVASLSLLAAVLSVKNKDLETANANERNAKEQATQQRDHVKELFRLSRVYGEMGATKSVADVFEVAAAKTQTLADEHPDVAEYQQILAMAHVNLGLWYKQTGKLGEAERAYERAGAIMQQLADINSNDIDYKRDLTHSQNNLALLYSDTGRFDEAVAAYGRILAEQQALADAHRDLPLFRVDVARTLTNRAVVYHAIGRSKDSERDYLDALAMREKLLSEHPRDRASQIDVANSYHNLGLLYLEEGRNIEAEEAVQKALTRRRAVADNYRLDAEIQEDLADTHNLLGGVFRGTKRHGKAIEEYQKALDIQRLLTAKHRNITSYQADLARTLQNLAVAFEETQKRNDAEKAHKEAQEILQRLTIANPQITDYAHQLAVNFNSQANLYVDMGRLLEAEKAYFDCLAIQERLALDHPDVVDYQRILGGVYGNLGLLLGGHQKKPATAMAWYDRSIRALEGFLRRNPKNASARETLGNIQTARGLSVLGAALLQKPADVATDWDRALDLYTGPDRAFLRLQRARASARMGEHTRAVAEASSLSKAQVSPSTEDLYDAAAVYAVSAAAVGKDDKLAGPEKEKLAEQYASYAIAALQAAKSADFFKEPANVERLKKDAEFSAVREQKDFKALLAELKKAE